MKKAREESPTPDFRLPTPDFMFARMARTKGQALIEKKIADQRELDRRRRRREQGPAQSPGGKIQRDQIDRGPAEPDHQVANPGCQLPCRAGESRQVNEVLERLPPAELRAPRPPPIKHVRDLHQRPVARLGQNLQ